MKRLFLSSLFGLVFGFVCYGFASSGDNAVPLMLALNIILSRLLIGVAIGISRFRMKHWAIHGSVMGFIFSLPMAFGATLGPDNPGFSDTMMFTSSLVMGIIYGFLIELIVSVFFKARYFEKAA
jgi:hypothetical protein